jgi:hypothetical protein
MTIDPFRLCLALGPMAVYLMLLGLLNLARRPFLLSGGRDCAALAVALGGLVLVGPMELFFPVLASIRFGTSVWIFLVLLYVLTVVLILLLLRPRLVVYNITPDQLRPILGDVVVNLDREARWAGDQLALPTLGVQLHLDSVGLLRNVSLLSSGPVQNHQGWHRLEKALTAALVQAEVPRNYGGGALLIGGLLLVTFLVFLVTPDPQVLARSFNEMLNW